VHVGQKKETCMCRQAKSYKKKIDIEVLNLVKAEFMCP